MKNSLLYTCLLFAVVFFIACKKDPPAPPPAPPSNIYKIELIAGDGQTDTTGNTLKNLLVYKVTLDGDTIK